METSNLSDKEFKIMVLKMITNLKRRMEEHSEIFIKEIENIFKIIPNICYRAEEHNNWTEKYSRGE